MNKRKLAKHITNAVTAVLRNNEFVGTILQSISAFDHTLEVIMRIPSKKEIADLLLLLPNLQQELNALDAKVYSQKGKEVTIHFGMRDLSKIGFDHSYIQPGTLKILLPSSYGFHELDFEDGASCHLLNGGAPRMGKTIFLLYLSTLLYKQTDGHIKMFITSPKAKDFYPLFNLPGVTISKDEQEFIDALDTMIDEYKARNKLLYSKAFEKATDAKTIKEFYPKSYHLFKPMFLIIDEYARFSENRSIQSKVAELVQTAGFVNVHVIITTQRPDARTTLPANIKMGLMARISFRTSDENNSIVILDEPGAEKLPNIKGRAILRDGDIHTVQVPHISYDKCMELLNPYRKEIIDHEPTQTKERQSNPELTNKIQDRFSQSDRIDIL